MAHKQIRIRQIRDFNSNITDTFNFLKSEAKPFFSGFLRTCGIPLLLGSILYALYSKSQISSFTRVMMGTNYSYSSRYTGFSLLGFLAGIFFLYFFYICSNTYTAAYLKKYIENKNKTPNYEDVWAETKAHLAASFGINILCLILSGIGFVFCFLPGIYLAVVLLIVPFIIVQDNDHGVGSATGKAFTLMKQNFWNSLLIYIVMYFIIGISGGLMGAVFMIGGILIETFSLHNLAFLTVIFTAISSIISNGVRVVSSISVGLNYYSIVESLDGIGMIDEINDLDFEEENRDNEVF